MSSHKQATSAAKKTAGKKTAGKKTAARGAPRTAASAEPSNEEKAAFVKAMWKGIEPGSQAAKTTEAKRGATGKAGTGKSGTGKAGSASAAATKTAAKKAPAKKAGKAAASKPAASKAAEKQPQVEVLRKISAQEQPELTPVSQSAVRLALDMEQALRNGDTEFLQPEAVQALMAALVRTYSAQDDAGIQYPVVGGRMVLTGTDVMIVCGALLKAVDLQVFELGMWQSWSGR